jgi:nucleoside 2-deoxyribosyltransferase
VKVYLASPLGFGESTRAFMDRLITALSEQVAVINPWDDHRFDDDFRRAPMIADTAERHALLAHINRELGKGNEERIRDSDGVVAVLDGVDVDSGTAAEVGFAYALGKRIYGLRTDFRLTGDNEAAGVNLQVRYFIDASGGKFVTSISELQRALSEWVAAKP